MWGVHAGLRQAVSAVKTMLSLSETLLAAGTLAVGRNTFTISGATQAQVSYCN